MAIRQSIPAVGETLESHTQALNAIKEAVELGQGNSRDFLKSFLTLERASQLGLIDAKGAGGSNKAPRYFDLDPNNPWVNYSIDVFYSRLGFYRDALGRVFMRGLITAGSSATVIATLPAGFRPQSRHIFGCYSSVAGEKISRIDIEPGGNVLYVSSGTPDFISLDGISFAAYQ